VLSPGVRTLLTYLWTLVVIVATAFSVAPSPSRPIVTAWLTTTDDAAGRHVVRGLQRQAPIRFTGGATAAGPTIVIRPDRTYQRFVGGGASLTDTAAWLLNSSGALAPSTRQGVMTALFDPVDGIGLSFLRNPLGASDLSRYDYSYDSLPPGQTDPGLDDFSIGHDLPDIVPLTLTAERLDPALTLMMTPWSAPAWMKTNDSRIHDGWLRSRYYPTYAQYFVKTIQAYQAQGIHVDYVSVQNEPTCCSHDTGHPSMDWDGRGLDTFARADLLPAFHAAGIDTKLLLLDYNWTDYDDLGSASIADPAVTSDPDFGGIAWHGYSGDVATQSSVHNRYPAVPAFDTEHSGGSWVSDQQRQDMSDIIGFTRNWGTTVTKWSLAVDQNHGPHAGGCADCTGLVTVHNGDGRSGAVDYTIEYYDMGQLTKFVRPGAVRIDSTLTPDVSDVAFRNPDGSTALIAYNGTSHPAPITVIDNGASFSYVLPARTTATFAW
jgi:glucosylceramidase